MSALEVCLRQGAVQIHVYLYLNSQLVMLCDYHRLNLYSKLSIFMQQNELSWVFRDTKR